MARPPRLVLDAGRVVLRPPVMSDYRQWADVRAKSRDFLTPWEPVWPRDALSRAAFRGRLRRNNQDMRADAGYGLLLMRRSDGQLLGGLTLSHIRRGVAQSGALGYWIGEPYARQGYMTDALTCMVNFCARQLHLHRLEAACLPTNVPSQRLLMKCGFRQEGRADAYLRINGHWHDHLLFGMVLDPQRVVSVPPAAASVTQPAPALRRTG